MTRALARVDGIVLYNKRTREASDTYEIHILLRTREALNHLYVFKIFIIGNFYTNRSFLLI